MLEKIYNLDMEIVDTKISNGKEFGDNFKRYQYQILVKSPNENCATVEYTDSHNNYINGVPLNMKNVLYSVVSDINIIRETGKDFKNVCEYLSDCLGYTDIKAIFRIAKDLLREYEDFEKLDIDWDYLNSQFENY